jgi:hypothetical protein
MEGVNKVKEVGDDFVFVYWDQYDPEDSQKEEGGN